MMSTTGQQRSTALHDGSEVHWSQWEPAFEVGRNSEGGWLAVRIKTPKFVMYGATAAEAAQAASDAMDYAASTNDGGQ